MTAMNITDNARKKALLLHLAGEAVYDIFQGLVVADVPADADQDVHNVYTTAKRALDAHFNPKRNTEYEIYTFRKARQTDNETLDAYHARLRALTKHCEFADTDAEIKSHIIQTCNLTRLRRKALTEPDLTLYQLIDIGRAMEMSERQLRSIENGTSRLTTTDSQPVAAIRHAAGRTRRQPPTQRQQSATCRYCGGHFPHPGGRSACPAYGSTCHQCSKTGHFSRVCRSQPTNQPAGSSSRHQNRGRFPSRQLQHQPADQPREQRSNHHRPVHRSIRQVTESQPDQNLADEDSEDSGEYLFHVNHQSSKQPQVTVKVNNDNLNFVIDSGASVNILDESSFSKLRPQPSLKRAQSNIYTYGAKSPLSLKGSFHAAVESNDRVTEAQIFVAAGNSGNLLSYKTASELGLIKIKVDTVKQDDGITVEKLAQKHPELFAGVGMLKNHQVQLHIDPNVKPVAQPHRRIPFHLQKMVEKEIQILLEQDIIEPVEGPTEWISPIVTPIKPNDPSKIRLCVDMRAANEAILRTRYVTPTLDDIIHDLNGATVFSKLDLHMAYTQLEIHPDSRAISNFSTHIGLFRYKRLFFGISSASEVFQHTISKVLRGLPGCLNISDDILIYGKTQAEHDKNLQAVIQRLLECNLTLAKEKCVFSQPTIEYYGHTFSAEGVSVQQKHVKALVEMSAPKNPAEVRSFLSMANYSSRFIKNLATISAPLRNLTKRNIPWQWGEREQQAFEAIKTGLENSTFTSYFDPNLRSSVIVDASPIGLACSLTQTKNGVRRVISYASRTLTPVETRYSQTEKEALACVYGCEHFRRYLTGAEFDLVTDHQPLRVIFGNPRAKLPARIERWGLRLMAFKFRVVHVKGDDNISDYLSRHPVRSTADDRLCSIAEQHVNNVIYHATPKAINLDSIKAETTHDPTLQSVLSALQSGDWRQAANDRQTRSYYNVRAELTVNAAQDIVLRGNRLCIPTALQSQCIEIAHSGHQGIVKTKSLLRQKVWFPDIDRLAEEAVRNCLACQANTPTYHNEPLKMSPCPKAEWSELSADFLGPLPTGEYLLVVHDEYSRFPVVEIIHSTSSKAVIPVLDKVFALLGNPVTLKTDNGPPFNSEEFKKFSEYLGFKHQKITPLWPQANAECERLMKSLAKIIRSARIEHKNWRQELYTFLRAYRSTPHSTTQQSPAEILLHRTFRTQLPEVTVDNQTTERDNRATFQEQDQKAKLKMKMYADAKGHAKSQTLQPGDSVLVRAPKVNKFSSYYDPVPYKVTDVKGSMITAARPGHMITRNTSFFKKISARIPDKQEKEEDTDYDDISITPKHQLQPQNQHHHQQQQQPEPGRIHPQRLRRLPNRLSDFVVN